VIERGVGMERPLFNTVVLRWQNYRIAECLRRPEYPPVVVGS
jgi:hypothetical protein